MKRAKLEICCGNINDIIAIDGLDYDRIELNCALELGGLTPSLYTLKRAKEITSKPIICMVRDRGGNFIHTQEEMEVMFNDAQNLIDNGADGVAFGYLNPDYTINVEALKRMRKITEGKELVFHRAFDHLKDKELAFKTLIECGVDRILLLAEQDEDIFDASRRVGKYNDIYGDKIQLLPGGGVNEENILEILELTKANQVHGTFKETITDPIYHTSYVQVSRERVANIIDILNK